jgi:hypothetical protein
MYPRSPLHPLISHPQNGYNLMLSSGKLALFHLASLLLLLNSQAIESSQLLWAMNGHLAT